MKRFLVFAGSYYYPSGGMNDFRGDFDTKEEAEACSRSSTADDWWHILDQETGEIIEKN